MLYPIVLYPNELIYSLLTRYHHMSGEKHPLKTYIHVTGVRGYKPLTGLPTRLNQIQRRILPAQRVDELINGHTHFGYYSPFISVRRREGILHAMREFGSTKSRLGLLRNHIGAAETLRYCTGCYKEDIEHNGVAYWHREHLLPSVFICPAHGEILSEVSLFKVDYHERALLLPGRGKKIINSIGDRGLNKLSDLSVQSQLILHSKLDGLIDQTVYQKILKRFNLLTDEGHIRQKELRSLVTEWLVDLQNVAIFFNLKELLKIERPWLSTMVADRREFHHPIKHLILFGALGLSFKEVMYAAMEDSEQLQLPLEFLKKPKLTKVDIQTAINSERSITEAARKLGCSVTTLTVEAEKHHIPFPRKTKYITQTLKNKVVLKAKSGLNSRRLAETFHLSICSINRILRVAGYKHTAGTTKH